MFKDKSKKAEKKFEDSLNNTENVCDENINIDEDIPTNEEMCEDISSDGNTLNDLNENCDSQDEELIEEPEIIEEVEKTEEEILLEENKLLEETVNFFKSQKSKLQDENKRITNENETLKERLAKLNFEYENYRKRTQKEKESIYSDACYDVMKEILPVIDNLERALIVDGSVDDFKKGVELTITQFNKALENLNIKEIDTDGEFDPNLHNAVMHLVDESLGNNVIVEVFQKGYERDGKVLRYSMVKVAN